MIDVHLPTTDGRQIVLTRYTQPEPELQLLIDRLKLTLPAQPPPKSPPPLSANPPGVVTTFWPKLLIRNMPSGHSCSNRRRRARAVTEQTELFSS
jgi:hypothetical protein